MAKTLSDTLRRAIKKSGLTRYAIEKQTGIAHQSLGRFMRGELTLRLDNVEKLADLLGLEFSEKRGK